MKPVPHNPDNLTAEQVGDGWRLLDVGELGFDNSSDKSLSAWNDKRKWVKWHLQTVDMFTYRTQLTREQLAARRAQ